MSKPKFDPGFIGPVQPKPPRSRKRTWLGRIIKFGFWVLVLVHLYALILAFAPVPTTINMIKRATPEQPIRKDWIAIEDVSPNIIRAVMAGEDSRFCEHKGVDWSAISEAMDDNAQGGKRRGGSTITQQTAKNVFFWNGGGYARKAGEAWAALFIDTIWGKRRVMEVYLNVAEWGDGIFGIEAASQIRFGKPASQLLPYEAALLASVLPSPNKWRVNPPGPYVESRAQTLMQRMNVIQTSRYDTCVRAKDGT